MVFSEKRRFRLADGSTVEKSVGLVLVEIDGGRTADDVITVTGGGKPLLGVTVLEHLGLAVDPNTRKLHKTDALPL